MKLAGRWETWNSIRRFVRDEPPAPPLRSKKKPKKKPKKQRKLRLDRVPGIKSYNEFDGCQLVRATHYQDHKRLLERRARGIYDRPRISDYAFALVRAARLVEADDGELTEIERIMLAASVQNDIRQIKLAESFR